jgi:hypothetical protein
MSNHLSFTPYKHNNTTRLESSKRPTLWIKRKLMLFITAFMIGMSNGMNIGDESLQQPHQTQKIDV